MSPDTTGPLHTAPSRYRIREATKDDVHGMTEAFFRSFNAPFWQHFMPDTPEKRKWWDEGEIISMNNPTDVNFLVEDTENNNKIVGFSRWMTPQQDGNLERKWPDMKPEEWDMEIVEKFFGGMEENRAEMMGKRPHWCMLLASPNRVKRIALISFSQFLRCWVFMKTTKIKALQPA